MHTCGNEKTLVRSKLQSEHIVYTAVIYALKHMYMLISLLLAAAVVAALIFLLFIYIVIVAMFLYTNNKWFNLAI
jgi:hypothetical protein